MKLFLIRHGETEENAAGILMGHLHGTLSEKGKTQARKVADILKNENFVHIYASDLNRCVDTAEFIKEFHPDTPLTFTKELRERNLGVLQGQVVKDIDWDGLPGEGDDKKPENGESVKELNKRVGNFIKELFNDYPTDTLLIVTHHGWIVSAMAVVAHIPVDNISENIKNGQIIKLEVDENITGKVLL